MRWTAAASRRSGRLTPVDADDDERPINGFVCDAEIRAFAIRCPGCGAAYEVKAGDRQSRVFDRREQRFRCSRCRFTAPVHLVVDAGFAPDEPDESPSRS